MQITYLLVHRPYPLVEIPIYFTYTLVHYLLFGGTSYGLPRYMVSASGQNQYCYTLLSDYQCSIESTKLRTTRQISLVSALTRGNGFESYVDSNGF